MCTSFDVYLCYHSEILPVSWSPVPSFTMPWISNPWRRKSRHLKKWLTLCKLKERIVCYFQKLYYFFSNLTLTLNSDYHLLTFNCVVVSPCFTDTYLIWTPHYYGQFPLSLGKENPYILFRFNLLSMVTLYGSLSVHIKGVWLYQHK